MESNYLFSETPMLKFYPVAHHCACGASTTTVKTSQKIIATLDIGEFRAVEKQTACKYCKQNFGSDELRALTPHRGKFGFDVIEYIGKSLFVHCQNESEIQTKLAARNIPISVREIGFLSKRFIVYLTLAHQECQAELKQYMHSKGGYILHMDGTCEGDSQHLFSCIDELSNIVLGNRKMPTEDSQHIIPLLQSLKAAYGIPIALVHDMGSAILKAVSAVFPGVADFICHFHFLRDLGKDLFDLEYRAIMRHTKSYGVRAKLNKTSKQLKTAIRDDELLRDSLETYLKDYEVNDVKDALDPKVAAYLLVSWILESSSVSNGFGFPFDRPHLEFHQRLQEAYPALKRLKEKGVSVLPMAAVSRALSDCVIKKMASRMQEKVAVFEALRKAMRIARVDNHKGLNDEGDQDIKTIESRIKRFRYSDEIVSLASSDISYRKMVNQIDRYWKKLFADPIEVSTPTGKITIQPQRTNNLLEQSFRFLKRDCRKRSGQHSLNKALKGMLANTPLVRNLANPDYVAILLKGEKTLAERFSAIDIEQVRREEQENKKRWERYPKKMPPIFKIPHLPEQLMKMASN